jgi:hypothetical protein
MENINKLRGHPFARTYQALMAVMERNSEKVDSKKRSQKAPLARAPKRRPKIEIPPNLVDASTVRPRSSDSGSTAESKDEEFIKSLLNDFVLDVLAILGAEGTRLEWPATPYYVALRKRYKYFLQD